jgi:hypothetical protein
MCPTLSIEDSAEDAGVRVAGIAVLVGTLLAVGVRVGGCVLVAVGAEVSVGAGVTVGPGDCPTPQAAMEMPDKNKTTARKITVKNCLGFMVFSLWYCNH